MLSYLRNCHIWLVERISAILFPIESRRLASNGWASLPKHNISNSELLELIFAEVWIIFGINQYIHSKCFRAKIYGFEGILIICIFLLYCFTKTPYTLLIYHMDGSVGDELPPLVWLMGHWQPMQVQKTCAILLWTEQQNRLSKELREPGAYFIWFSEASVVSFGNYQFWLWIIFVEIEDDVSLFYSWKAIVVLEIQF